MATILDQQPRRHPSTRIIASYVALFGCCLLACSTVALGENKEKKTGTNESITAAEVKNYVTHYWTHDCQDFEECTITFDSEVRINPPERHRFPNGLTANCYPVKVDFTGFRRNKTINDKGLTSRHRGGVYYFYRNSFDEWRMESEDVEVTRK